eukprot:349975-Chlamydomonas_euryale.AAC.1
MRPCILCFCFPACASAPFHSPCTYAPALVAGGTAVRTAALRGWALLFTQARFGFSSSQVEGLLEGMAVFMTSDKSVEVRAASGEVVALLCSAYNLSLRAWADGTGDDDDDDDGSFVDSEFGDADAVSMASEVPDSLDGLVHRMRDLATHNRADALRWGRAGARCEVVGGGGKKSVFDSLGRVWCAACAELTDVLCVHNRGGACRRVRTWNCVDMELCGGGGMRIKGDPWRQHCSGWGGRRCGPSGTVPTKVQGPGSLAWTTHLALYLSSFHCLSWTQILPYLLPPNHNHCKEHH